MTTETIEGNKLIAEFLNAPFDWDAIGQETAWIKLPNKELSSWARCVDLKYHSSWDWLMPVVEKIESLGRFSFEIDLNSAHVYEMDFDKSELTIEAHENSKIASTWLAVVEFINWFNQNK